ncbi:MAG TPA: ABC transporter permease subunit, partial [Arenibaculum sp.]|nr:ABC transporter permease subunit [Arenibaculum sp.]
MAGLGRASLSLALLVAVWQTASAMLGSRLLPGIDGVALALWREATEGDLYLHLGATLARVAAAFAIAMLVGSAIGIAMGRSATAASLFGPWIALLLNLPALVVIVLAYVWFGLFEAAAIGAVAINKVPNAAVMMREGARSIDEACLEVARVYRLSRWETLRHF